MGNLRKIVVRILGYLTNHVVCHVPSNILRRGWYGLMGLNLAPGATIAMSCYLWFYGPGQLARGATSIGRNTVINRNCCIDARGTLVIGENVSISPDVAIITTQHDVSSQDFALQSRPVVIEDNVWIGMRAIVLPGASIGRGAVVAAGAVVSGDVPACSVVAGVPARVVGTRPESATRYVFDGRPLLFE